VSVSPSPLTLINLGMTFLIGETCLGWVGVFIYLPFLTWLALKHLPGSGQVR
jgi:hypothetical protein